MYSKDQWIAEHERILDELAADAITPELAAHRLRELGFDNEEVEEQLRMAKE